MLNLQQVVNLRNKHEDINDYAQALKRIKPAAYQPVAFRAQILDLCTQHTPEHHRQHAQADTTKSRETPKAATNKHTNTQPRSLTTCPELPEDPTYTKSNNIIYKRINTKGDGNCFYASIAYQLKRLLGDSNPEEFANIDHKQVRTSMYCTTNLKQQLNPKEEIIWCDDNYPWHQQQFETTYADEHSIRHTVSTYNICVALHRNCDPPWPVQLIYPTGYDTENAAQNPLPTINIERCAYGYPDMHNDANFDHYQPLIETTLMELPRAPRTTRATEPIHDDPPTPTKKPAKQKERSTKKLRIIDELPNTRVGIGPSLLGKQAGEGLFLFETVNAGHWVADYGGAIITREQANASTSRYILRHPTNKELYIDAQNPTSGYGRFANDPLDKSKENLRMAVLPALEHTDPTQPKPPDRVGYRSTKEIKKGNEGYIAYGGEYWANSRYDIDTRRRAAKRYPEYADHILHAEGEGDCAHDKCIQLRLQHIQDIMNDTDMPPTPDLSCRMCNDEVDKSTAPASSNKQTNQHSDKQTNTQTLKQTNIKTQPPLSQSRGPPPPADKPDNKRINKKSPSLIKQTANRPPQQVLGGKQKLWATSSTTLSLSKHTIRNTRQMNITDAFAAYDKKPKGEG